MKRIYTLTLNPALDKSTTVQRVLHERKLRCEKPKFEPGGGGINVSRAIKKLGGSSIAVFPVGGPMGVFMQELLTREDIEQITVPTKNWTRENFTVVETETNRQYRFGMPGPALFENEWKACLKIIAQAKNDIEYLVVSGSAPAGVPVDFYARIACEAAKHDIKFILDTSGDPLKAAVEEGVYLLKPNINELSQLVGRKLEEIHEQEDAAMEVINKGKVNVLIVSLGAAGAMLASKEGLIHVSAPSVKSKSTVGAGDSMLAGIIFTLTKGKSFIDALQYGVASGTAATMNPGTELCKLKDVENLNRWIVKNSIKPSDNKY